MTTEAHPMTTVTPIRPEQPHPNPVAPPQPTVPKSALDWVADDGHLPCHRLTDPADLVQVVPLLHEFLMSGDSWGRIPPTEDNLRQLTQLMGQQIQGILKGAVVVVPGVGFGAAGATEPNMTHAVVLGLWVRPTCRGQGYGRELAQTLSQALREQGIRATILMVDARDKTTLRALQGSSAATPLSVTVLLDLEQL